MPYTSQHKAQSRKKILESAFACFAARGYENTSIDEIMQHADMTRGAFYAHFGSKSELYRQAMLTGAYNSPIMNSRPEDCLTQTWLQQLIKAYLSDEHVQQKSHACPLAFLVTDVAVQEAPVRKTYTRIFANMNKLLQERMQLDSEQAKQRIYAITSMLIGAVAICRALDDKKLRKTVLKACEVLALNLLNANDTLPEPV